MFGVSFSSAFGILVKIIVIFVCAIAGIALFGYLGLAHGKALRKVIGWIVVAIGIITLVSTLSNDPNKAYESSYNWCIEWHQKSPSNKMGAKAIADECAKTAQVASESTVSQRNTMTWIGIVVIGVGGIILPEDKKKVVQQKSVQKNNNAQ